MVEEVLAVVFSEDHDVYLGLIDGSALLNKARHNESAGVAVP